MVYALDAERREELVTRSLEAIGELDGVDLALWLTGADRGEAVVRSSTGELRFAPGEQLEDARGRRWSIEGDKAVLDLRIDGDRVTSEDYPDALARAWSALKCPTAGDVLLSAAPGYEFVDWGGADHVGGGSHGSLHRSDSLGALLWCGTGPETRAGREMWSLIDVAPMVRQHFAVQNGQD
jgi:hypothetical protein